MKVINLFICSVFIFQISCKKSSTNPGNTHPFAGTVRLFEEKRNYSLKYYNNTVTRGFYFRLGTEELIELTPGIIKDQYFIRPKDYQDWCLEYSTRNEFDLKLFPYNGNDAQLFIIKDIGNNKVRIQCAVDTSLYLLNDSDLATSGPSSFLKQKSTYPTALDYWIIEKL